jgi:hypothetical protein
MKYRLTINTSETGPYTSATVESDHYLCDGTILYFSVVGAGGVIDQVADDWTRPLTPEEQAIQDAEDANSQASAEETARNDVLVVAQNQESVYQTLSLLVQTNIDPTVLNDTDLAKVSSYYKQWSGESISYAVNDSANYETELYRCIQAHTSQPGWNPPAVPALWTIYIDPTGPATAWVQPLGAHDAYAKGLRVTHNALTWVSDIDANVWEPGVYGWTVE